MMDIEWVKQWFEWSVENAWKTLKAKLIADIEEWQSLVKEPRAFALTMSERSSTVFEVQIRDPSVLTTPVIRLTQRDRNLEVTVLRLGLMKSVETLSLSPVLNNEAQPKLLLNVPSLEFLEVWQVSFRILEPLFSQIQALGL